MTASQDTSAPGCASAESAPLPIRLHHAVQQQHALGSGIGPKLIDRRSPHASASRGIVTFIAGRRSGDFVESVKHANTCAVARRHRIPSRAGSLFGRMGIFSCDSTAHRCAQSKSKRFLPAYGAAPLAVQHLPRRQPARTATPHELRTVRRLTRHYRSTPSLRPNDLSSNLAIRRFRRFQTPKYHRLPPYSSVHEPTVAPQTRLRHLGIPSQMCCLT